MAAGDVTITVSATGTTTDNVAIPTWSKTKTFTSIADMYFRTGLITSTTVQNLILIGTSAGATLAALNCFMLYNRDATDSVIVGFIDTGAESVYVRVGPGETLCYMDDQIDCDDDAGGAFGTFNSVDTITIDAVANTPRVDVLAF